MGFNSAFKGLTCLFILFQRYVKNQKHVTLDVKKVEGGCCLNSGVWWWIQVLSIVINQHTKSFFFVKMLQALFRDFHASAFLICCEQARQPSCAKLFHIQFFMQNISYTLFWNAYSLSNFSTFIRRSSNTISSTSSMISGGVPLFWRPSRGSSSRLVRPRLNSASHFLIVENEGEESP